MKKTKLVCQNCKTEILSVEICKGLTITCPVCTHEILLNVEAEQEPVVKMRPPKKERQVI